MTFLSPLKGRLRMRRGSGSRSLRSSWRELQILAEMDRSELITESNHRARLRPQLHIHLLVLLLSAHCVADSPNSREV